MAKEDGDGDCGGGRYPSDPALSPYFEAIGRLHPELATGDTPPSLRGAIWVPRRRFQPKALILPGGGSLIESISRLGRFVVIQDGDLTPPILCEHLRIFGLTDLSVYDLTGYLHLSSNHLYVISREPESMPCGAWGK